MRRAPVAATLGDMGEGHRSVVSTGCLVIVLVICFVAVTSGCGAAGSLLESSTGRAADRHADVAGTVMTRDNWERSANDAAWLVVGQAGDTTIDALEAAGTTYHGKVVLRISVDGTDRFGADSSVTKCYSYTFRHELDDGKPTGVACTDAVVALTPPAAEPDFDTTASARLAAILRGLVRAHTIDAATAQRRVAAAFGPPVTVSAGPANDGSLFVRLDVPSHWECMWGDVSAAGRVTTGTGNRRDCAN